MNREQVTPIPRDHLAKILGVSGEWIKTLILRQGRIPTLELVQDSETLGSKLVPHTSGRAKPQSLFVDPAVAAVCKEILGEKIYTQSKGPRRPRVTRETWEKAFINLPQKNLLVPVPLSHLAKRTDLALDTIMTAIKTGNLQIVEFIFDEQSKTSKLVPYTYGGDSTRQGRALYVLPDEAESFAADVKMNKTELLQQSRRPEGITGELEQQILQTAKRIKIESPAGEVQRTLVLESLTGKRDDMRLYEKIKYILDQHREEFPPHRSGPHAFLSHKKG